MEQQSDNVGTPFWASAPHPSPQLVNAPEGLSIQAGGRSQGHTRRPRPHVVRPLLRRVYRGLNSIRWRLPLSYAAIALLTSLVLGTVLLNTLERYYAEQERTYLQENARAIRPVIEELVNGEAASDIITYVADRYALFSRTRIVVSSGEVTLADTGNPNDIQLFTVSFPPTNEGPDIYIDAGEPFGINTVGSITYTDGGDGFASAGGAHSVSALPLYGPFPAGSRPAPTYHIEDVPLGEVLIFAGDVHPPRINPVTMFASPYGGYQFGEGGLREAWRDAEPVLNLISDEQVRLTFEGGVLQLSGGPALGTTILSNVRRGLLGAGLVATLLSALIGWIASRQISRPVLTLAHATERMAEGDLSTRVSLSRRDEFASLASTFNLMAERVEGTIVTLKQFVADAAHQIHTPLTALQTNLELAATDPTNPRYVESARRQVSRLVALTDHLLELARLEGRTESSPHQPLDWRTVVGQVCEVYASRTEQADIQFTLALPSETVTVLGDERELSHALDNLLDNALKFTPTGGAVAVQLSATGVLTISDTGIGIPEDDQPHIFGRFHRGRNAAAYAGSGIGLMLTKAIMEQHGGAISFTSGADGTRFNLRLPLHEAA